MPDGSYSTNAAAGSSACSSDSLHVCAKGVDGSNNVQSSRDGCGYGVFDVIRAEINHENIRGEYMAIYADIFTDEQLAGFQDFFRIPVGQPWVEKQSEVMMWILQIWQSKMADIMPAEHGRNDERYAAGRVACSRPGYSERA